MVGRCLLSVIISTMIPIELKIEGFLSYLDPVEIDFTGFDLACITGENGAGTDAGNLGRGSRRVLRAVRGGRRVRSHVRGRAAHRGGRLIDRPPPGWVESAPARHGARADLHSFPPIVIEGPGFRPDPRPGRVHGSCRCLT